MHVQAPVYGVVSLFLLHRCRAVSSGCVAVISVCVAVSSVCVAVSSGCVAVISVCVDVSSVCMTVVRVAVGYTTDTMYFAWLDNAAEVDDANQIPQYTLKEIIKLDCTQVYVGGTSIRHRATLGCRQRYLRRRRCGTLGRYRQYDVHVRCVLQTYH